MATVMPIELKDLLADLDFFARLPIGKIPNIKRKCYDDPYSVCDRVKRTYDWTECRDKTLKTIDKLLAEVIRAAHTYRYSDSYPEILNYLERFREGIFNIPRGYPNDPNIRSRIQVIVTQIDLDLKKNGRIPQPLEEGGVVSSTEPASPCGFLPDCLP